MFAIWQQLIGYLHAILLKMLELKYMVNYFITVFCFHAIAPVIFVAATLGLVKAI